MATKTGGAAFPRSGADWMDTGGRVYNDSQRGMTLRDYFAIRATEVDIVSRQAINCELTREQARYDFADDMLTARGDA